MGNVKIVKCLEVQSKAFTPGCYEKWVFDKDTPTKSMVWAFVIFDRGAKSGMHKHDAEEVLHVVRGRGRVTADGKDHEVGPDTSIYVPAETPHSLANIGEESFVVVLCMNKKEVETAML